MIPALAHALGLATVLGVAYLLISWRVRPFPVAAYGVLGAAAGLVVGLACWWPVLSANARRSFLVLVAWCPLLGLGFAVVGALGALALVGIARGGAFYWSRRR